MGTKEVRTPIKRLPMAPGLDGFFQSGNLPLDRYIAALERQLARIEAGLELGLDDCNDTGYKHTSATWGLCSDEKAAWPDPQDHIWPEQFEKEGRVAPLDQHDGDHCPFDDIKRRSAVMRNSTFGCFYSCMLFRPFDRRFASSQRRPSREEAVQLYKTRIEEAKKELIK